MPATVTSNLLYKSSIYLGQSGQELSLILDTSSDRLVVEGSSCATCEGNTYDTTSSDYFEIVNQQFREMSYGSLVHLLGREVSDMVCLKKNWICVDPFKFFLVSEQVGLPVDADGILGLAMGYSPRSSQQLPSDFNVGTLLVDSLRMNGHITTRSFSTLFSNQDSYIEFGPINLENTSGELIELQLSEGYFWTVVPEAIKFGSDEYGLDGSIEAIITTGVSLSFVPSSISLEFFSYMLKDT